MPKATLRLTSESCVAKDARLYLDGRDISNAAKAVTIHCAVGEPTIATLTVFVDKLDVDTKAVLDLNVANTELLARQLASVTGREHDEVLARVAEIQRERVEAVARCETTALADTSRKFCRPEDAHA